MAFGLSSSGFSLKRFEDIIAELKIAFQGAYGDETNFEADAVLGNLVNLESEALATVYEVLQAIYDSSYPLSAEGVSLDNVASIIGLNRLPATKSTVTETLTGTPATAIPAGSVISVLNTSNNFVTLALATIGAGGTVTAAMEAQVAGAVVAPAGSLTVIETPVSGWTSAVNSLDATVGRELETDTEFRIRYLASLSIVGAATVDAIKARIEDDVDDVIDAFVFENASDVTDGDGRPPHSFESVVSGGTEQDIGDEIWLVKAAGIATFGTITKVVTDTMGFTHNVSFSRPTDIDIWFHVTISVDTAFDTGAKQDVLVTVDTVTDTTLYTVTINNVAFTFTSDGTATVNEITLGLVTAINLHAANGWVPVTATDNVDGTFSLVSDWEGNAFLSVPDSKMSQATVVANSGDQQLVINEIAAFALTEQTIGVDVSISRYYSPVNDVPNITAISIEHEDTTTPVLPPGAWSTAASIAIAATELAVFDTLRISVEVV